MARNTDFIVTYSGKKIHPINPNPEDIDIIDIAHALSMICRFGGHSKEFYSVSSHSYICSSLTEDSNLALILLLHDASEAYIHDIITPLKPHINNYKEIENNIMKAIFEKFGLPWPINEDIKKQVKRIDNIMLITEFKWLMKCTPDNFEIEKYYNPIDIQIRGCNPEIAEKYFLDRFEKLMRIKKEKEIQNVN